MITDEQRARSERNRLRALSIRASKRAPITNSIKVRGVTWRADNIRLAKQLVRHEFKVVLCNDLTHEHDPDAVRVELHTPTETNLLLGYISRDENRTIREGAVKQTRLARIEADPHPSVWISVTY